MDNGHSLDPLTHKRFQTRWVGRDEWIVIPAARNWLMLPMLSLWLILWTAGGIIAMGIMVAGTERAFFALWLVGWALGWVFAAAIIVWQIAGHYRVTMAHGALHYAWSMPLLSGSARYDLDQIRNLRAARHMRFPPFGAFLVRSSVPPFVQRLQWPNFSKSILFEYGGRKTALHLGLTEAETMLVIDWLRRRTARMLDETA